MPNSTFSTTAYVTGLICLNVAFAMLVPMVVDIMDGNNDWQAFLTSALIVGILSGFVVLTSRRTLAPFSIKLGFLMVNAIWICTVLAAALPYLLSGQNVDFADAVFESVSGFTTTGATIFTDLDHMPRGLLLWRSLTQWLGGIGILAMGMVLLPYLRVGGMQVFKLESSNQTDSAIARFAEFTIATILLYATLTLLCVMGYLMAGMTLFDALNHAMATISTGGFSTHNSSLSRYGSGVHLVAIVFMVAGAMPFAAMLRALVTRRVANAYDPQIPFLLAILGVLTALAMIDALPARNRGFFDALIHSAFNVTSLVTTTGFVSTDYSTWGPLTAGVVLIATFVGGAAGSTAGGIKTYRLMILYENVRMAMRELMYPHGVFAVRYGRRQVAAQTLRSVSIFFAAFMGLLIAATLGLTATGLDLLTAFTGALTALSNVGPGLGQVIGPSGNFASLSDAAKWILSLSMLMGRLEIMTMLVLVMPVFWRR